MRSTHNVLRQNFYVSVFSLISKWNKDQILAPSVSASVPVHLGPADCFPATLAKLQRPWRNHVEDLRKVSSLLEITMLLLLPCKQKLNILHYTQERKLRVCTQKLFNTPMRTAYIPLESTAIGQTSRGNVAVPLFTKQLKFFIVVLALNNLFQKQQMLLLWSLKSN